MDRRRFLAALAAVASPGGGLASARARPARSAPFAPAFPLSGPSDRGTAWARFRDYDPQRDPDAPFFRSQVPRQNRIAAFAATQAHPALDPRARAAALVAPYLPLDGGADTLNPVRSSAATGRVPHVERFWQYLDIVVGWNGTGLVPNPALTDAAHRNGVLCLGTVFQPDRRLFDGTDLPSPEVARRLVALAAYFGFDGYFINFEAYGSPDAAQVADLVAAMKSEARSRGIADFHIQVYDGRTRLTSVWPGPAHQDGRPRALSEPRADSLMLDQGWSRYGDRAATCCSGAPLSHPYGPGEPGFPGIGALFYGFQLYPGPGYFGLAAPRVGPPGGAPALGSYQIYSVEDGLRTMREARLDALAGLAHRSAAEAGDVAAFTGPTTRRTAWYGLHRRFWSGQSGDPAADNAPTADQRRRYGPPEADRRYTPYRPPRVRTTDQVGLPITYGVADFVVERSVIAALPFATAFNTGEGDAFWCAGRRISEHGWFDLGCQDVLPTWSWWVRPLAPAGASRLPPLAVDYDYGWAHDGGTSLRISGRLDPRNGSEIRLFKTDVTLPADAEVALVVRRPQPSSARILVGLTFRDRPDTVVWREAVPGSLGIGEAGPDLTCALSDFAGRPLAALSVGVAAAGERPVAVDIGIGRLVLRSAADMSVPARPEDFRLEGIAHGADGRTAQMRLRWTRDPTVRHYDVVRGSAAAPEAWLGRAVCDALFVERIDRAGDAAETVLSLIPCGPDGRAGEAARLAAAWPSP